MNLELDPLETRVLGALMEKEKATPDYYPLSMSALTAACNQKSNRDPVMNLSEHQVQDTIDGLVGKQLVRERNSAGSRVSKYAHRFSDELGLSFDLSSEGVALLCTLMVRGPQTVGELRAHTQRLHDFAGSDEIESALSRLREHERGPYVVRLARQPGRREVRYTHLFGGEPADADASSESFETNPQVPVARVIEPDSDALERIAALEQEVAALRTELDQLKRSLGE